MPSSAPHILPYAGIQPNIARPLVHAGPGSAVLGRVTLGRNAWLGALSVPLKILTWGRFADHPFKFFLASLDAEDLGYLAGLMSSGRLKSVIDRTYPLAQVPEAVAYVEEGHARGKVVIDLD